MNRLAVLSLVLVVAACGGNKSSTTPEMTDPGAGGGGRMAAPGTVLGDPAVYAKATSSTIALPAGYEQSMLCSGAATLGEQVQAWAKEMGGPISATCDGNKCRVELATPLNPSCDTSSEECEGAAYLIEFELGDDGEIVSKSLMCMSAG
jgi:hypothetical protein